MKQHQIDEIHRMYGIPKDDQRSVTKQLILRIPARFRGTIATDYELRDGREPDCLIREHAIIHVLEKAGQAISDTPRWVESKSRAFFGEQGFNGLGRSQKM